jgi:hypothetical protein
MKRYALIITLSFFSVCLNAQDIKDSAHLKHHQPVNKTMKFEIPSSLKEEHKELHESLEKFTYLPGKTGQAAKDLAKVLHPHFVKEEEFAMPQLGLLYDLAKGQVTNDMKETISMSDKLKKEWQEMLSEHKQIVAYIDKLSKAAKEEKQQQVLRFTEALKLHAKTEEEVLYPASILVGEYLKLKM